MNWVVSRASAVGLVVALVGCSGAETLPGSFEARDGAKEDSADGKTRSYDCDTPSWNDSDWLAESGCYYVLDVRELYLNTWCYAVGSCTAGTPPSGTTIEQQIDRHDQLAFLTSLQGIVNRDRATLFLVAEDKPDAEWLRLLAKENIWLNDMHRVDVASVDDAITLFADHPALKGSVRWSDAEPFTMNVAFSLAGADDLVVVREGSAFADKVTARFPVQESLGGRFASKRAGYEWLIDNYLTTGKLAPELALYTDGWVVNRAKAGNFLSLGWALMPRDGLVARRQMFIGYGVHPNGPDPSQPSAPKGEGRTVLGKAFAAIRARVGPNKLITAGGWPSAEYSFDCNGDNVINGSDKVGCEEWEWTEFASTLGAVLRMGGPGAYAKEAANASFYQHGPGVDVLDQPAPKTPFELLEDGDIAGPPANFSFEAGDASWTLTATNRAVYNQAANAQHGSRFLQANVSAGDVGKGFYQDTTANLPTGSLVRFSIQARATSAGANAKGRLRVTAGGNQLCLTSFTLNDSTWRELDCDFEVKSAGLANPRIEVLLDTAGPNYAFDTAQLLGTGQVTVRPGRRFVMFYMGDYDALNPAIIVPIGVHPFTWTTPAARTSTGWSMGADFAAQAPPIFAYFAKTKNDLQTFVMPDSGAGYLNPGYLPNAVVADWLTQTAAHQRRFGYRNGWVLNGHGTASVRASNATGTKIRNMYRAIAPDGIYYNGVLSEASFVEGGMPVLPMGDGFLYAGASKENAATKLAADVNGSASPFSVFRTVFVSDAFIEGVVDLARTKGAAFQVLDPQAFMYLYRSSQGSGTAGRLQVLAHTLPDTLEAGESVSVTFTVRNDGWDAWRSTPLSGPSCDGAATAGKGCEQLAFGFSADPVLPTGWGALPKFPYGGRAKFPSPVFPSDTIDVQATVTAPTEPGTYYFQLDGVKELYSYFETRGNVPWQKEIVVR